MVLCGGVGIYELMRWIMAFTKMKWDRMDGCFPNGISIGFFK